ncbi:MAG: hypothetical protein M0R06_04380 [Sphaerochaeta sp.]|jgi:hypothetical protein|nr:hypothetical protein [Sphaerochaeta sp.]
MSLDVYLKVDEPVLVQGCTGVFIRENGVQRELAADEVEKYFPDSEPFRLESTEEVTDTVFHANITHNLGAMAREAGVYQAVWRPEEIDIEYAGQLIEPLDQAICLLTADPERFKAFNPSNGWGDYDGLLNFLAEYAAACIKWPQAKIVVSR